MTPKLPIFFIVMTVVIDAMGIGLIIPVMPQLLLEVLPTATLGQAAIWGGIMAMLFSLMQFLFGPMLGSLSDQYGRKPLLLVTLVIMALGYLIMALAGGIWLLLFGRIIGGISSATQSTAAAYIADISKPDEKAGNFGLISAGFGIGFVLGPLLGGALVEFGTRAPFYAAGLLALANALFGAVVLRESLTASTRQAFEWRRANPLSAFRYIGQFKDLTALLWVSFCFYISVAVYPAIWVYYTTERFDWSPGLIGVSLAVYGGSTVLVQTVLIRLANRYLGDNKTVKLGLIIQIPTLAMIALVGDGTLLLALTPLAALGSIGTPALQAIMSRAVGTESQGALQGVLASLNAFATMIALLAMTQIFAHFSSGDALVYLPGAPFLVSALLMALGLGLFWRLQLSAKA